MNSLTRELEARGNVSVQPIAAPGVQPLAPYLTKIADLQRELEKLNTTLTHED